MLRTFLISVLASAIYTAEGCGRCDERSIRWTGGDAILWPSPNIRQVYQETGSFIKKNILATRAVIHEDNVIVTIPRFKHGVPLTLGVLSLAGEGCEARLLPFPDWRLQDEGDCRALQSAVDVYLDADRDLVWVLDVGVVDAMEKPVYRCPPKIVAVDAASKKVVRSIDLSHLVKPTSRLQYLVAERSADERVYLYVSDASDHSLIVYDVAHSFGFRLSLPRVVASSCTRCDVLFTALMDRSAGGKNLVFGYQDGEDVFSIGTELLRSGLAEPIRRVWSKPRDLVVLGVDHGSGMYYRREEDSDVYRRDLTAAKAAGDGLRLYGGAGDFLLASQVVPDSKCGRMRVLESNFPDYFEGTVRFGVKHSLRLL